MARTRASDFEEKQHGILMSAAAVFAEQGMDKASMAQIASHWASRRRCSTTITRARTR